VSSVQPTGRQALVNDSVLAPRALSAREALQRWRCPLPAMFYERDPVEVAQALLGCLLLHRTDAGIGGGRIVEVEAYLGPGDPASHAVAGRTARTHHLFGAPGTAYVYRIYGMHWCVNAVTQHHGSGSAVLLRAVAPMAGLQQLEQRTPDARAGRDALCRGPGRLCRALGIDRSTDGTSLVGGPLRIAASPVPTAAPIRRTPRIGISKAIDWPLRFLLDGESAVSGTRRQNAPADADQAW
jgi:DNA-3-methyladenine glycosylase